MFIEKDKIPKSNSFVLKSSTLEEVRISLIVTARFA